MGQLLSNEIEVGKQYQYEEKYYFAAIVTILEKEVENEEEGEYLKLKVRIDRIIGSIIGRIVENKEFEVYGYLTGTRKFYRSWKIKPLGSMTDYMYPVKAVDKQI
jgi:hypothetical protein